MGYSEESSSYGTDDYFTAGSPTRGRQLNLSRDRSPIDAFSHRSKAYSNRPANRKELMSPLHRRRRPSREYSPNHQFSYRRQRSPNYSFSHSRLRNPNRPHERTSKKLKR